MASDNFVQIAPQSTGLKIDTSELTVNGNTVERQRIVIADPSASESFVAVSSGGALTSMLSDGTNTANVSAGDSGQNSLITARGRKSVTYSTTTAANVGTTDVSNYSWVSVHQTSVGTGTVITPQGSNDNVNWVAVSLMSAASTSYFAQPVTSVAAAGSIYCGPCNFRYFQLALTGITAGTAAGTIEFFTIAPPQFSSQSSLAGVQTVSLNTLSGQGATPTRLISAATTNATLVKNAAGTLFYIQAFNVNSSTRYLKLYNLATAPTVGTSAPIMTIQLPTNAPQLLEFEAGVLFSSGISFAITANLADSDTTAVAAGDVVVNLQYK